MSGHEVTRGRARAGLRTPHRTRYPSGPSPMTRSGPRRGGHRPGYGRFTRDLGPSIAGPLSLVAPPAGQGPIGADLCAERNTLPEVSPDDRVDLPGLDLHQPLRRVIRRRYQVPAPGRTGQRGKGQPLGKAGAPAGVPGPQGVKN